LLISFESELDKVQYLEYFFDVDCFILKRKGGDGCLLMVTT